MDEKRTQTYVFTINHVLDIISLFYRLEALEAFIQSQKTLLDTAYSDIQLLREAKARAIADPHTFLNNIHAEVFIIFSCLTYPCSF